MEQPKTIHESLAEEVYTLGWNDAKAELRWILESQGAEALVRFLMGEAVKNPGVRTDA